MLSEEELTFLDKTLDQYEDELSYKNKYTAIIDITKIRFKNRFNKSLSEDQKKYIDASLKLLLKSYKYIN
jgi:hypothetical protein